MEKTLKELGLTDKEINVYLTLLSVGETSASVIAYKTSIPVSTIHYICDRLKKKKLLTSHKKGNSIIYTPESPEKILYLLEQERLDLLEKEEGLQRVMGQLEALADPATLLPKVAFESQKSQVLKAYQDFFNNLGQDDLMYCFAHPVEGQTEELGKILVQIHDEIQPKKNFRQRCICNDSPFARKLEETANDFDREIRIIKKSFKTQFSFGMLMSNDMVLEIGFSNEGIFSSTIRHPLVVHMRRGLFELAWDHLPKH